MEVAQGNMKKMLEKVNAETKAVEDAIEDLKRRRRHPKEALIANSSTSRVVDWSSRPRSREAFCLHSGAGRKSSPFWPETRRTHCQR